MHVIFIFWNVYWSEAESLNICFYFLLFVCFMIMRMIFKGHIRDILILVCDPISIGFFRMNSFIRIWIYEYVCLLFRYVLLAYFQYFISHIFYIFILMHDNISQVNYGFLMIQIYLLMMRILIPFFELLGCWLKCSANRL